MADFTLGVEEEFQLVDARTGAVRTDIEAVLGRTGPALGAEVQPELQASQVEIGSPVCTTLAEVRSELERLRRAVGAAAADVGCRIAATATHPLATAADSAIGPEPRYERLEEGYGQLAREQFIAGCHVHVGLDDRELAVQVMNRSRPWLATILAISANSPFWQGADTGHASFRYATWGRWPTAGPPAVFRGRAEYDEVVDQLLATGVIDDRGMVYWDVRASARFETVEYRVADVCLRVDDAVLLAGLLRGVARMAAREALAEAPTDDVRPEVLRAMLWRAARTGLTGELVDPFTGQPAPAAEVARRLLARVRPALDEAGDTAEVNDLLEATLARGSGAELQRATFRRAGRLQDVLAYVVEETARP